MSEHFEDMISINLLKKITDKSVLHYLETMKNELLGGENSHGLFFHWQIEMISREYRISYIFLQISLSKPQISIEN
jgi:hypothetical protein